MKLPLIAILLVLLASCGSTRINPVQMDGLEVGMTVEQVRDLIGRPWHLIVRPFGPETHWYVMARDVTHEPIHKGKSFEFQVNHSQYRVLELTYVNGVLVPYGSVPTASSEPQQPPDAEAR